MAWIQKLIEYLATLFKWETELEPMPEPIPTPPVVPTPPVEPVKPPTAQERLYTLSKSLLGQKLGKDKSIPIGVNCANACSDVLIRFGIKGLPPKGIAGTYQLGRFLEDSPLFKETGEYKAGNVIINQTGTGNDKIRGHVGICGNTSIMSNNSENGLWDTQFNWERWRKYYQVYGGIKTRFFEPVNNTH